MKKDDPLNVYRQPTNETYLQSVLPDYPVTIQSNKNCSLGNEVYDIVYIWISKFNAIIATIC